MSHGRFSSIRQGRIGKTNGDSWIRQGLSRKVSRSLTVVAREFHSEAHLSRTLEAYNSTRRELQWPITALPCIELYQVLGHG